MAGQVFNGRLGVLRVVDVNLVFLEYSRQKETSRLGVVDD
jgi:hypothetical protein